MARLVLALAALGCVTQPAAADKPNVIVIVSDDQGYHDLGVQGCKDIPTPHIDSIAKNGVRCTNGYVSHPYCSPTRAGLMTGRYQQRFGHEFNPGPPTDKAPDVGLPLSETTFADRMRAAGYKTGIVGKWHLGHADDKFHPLNRGFDEFFGFLGGSHSYVRPGAGVAGIFRGRDQVDEKEYLTDAFAREGAAFIDRHAKEPFFLYWAFNAVHGPLDAAERYKDRFAGITDPKRKTYATMLTALDDAVGKGLAKLKEHGLEGNTLIFFCSDNGGPTAVNASDNSPLSGVKGTTWEGGVRVPFLVQYPGKLPAGKVYDQPVIALDIQPTALAAAGVAAKPEWKFEGVDLLPYLTGAKADAPHAALYWRFGGQWAVRAGDWKLAKTAPGRDRNEAGGAASRREKATVEGAKLFNLKDDVGEKEDLAAKNPEKVKELTALWQKWDADNVAPRWGAPSRAKAE
jgi:arylsulfatase A-like enzyme